MIRLLEGDHLFCRRIAAYSRSNTLSYYFGIIAKGGESFGVSPYRSSTFSLNTLEMSFLGWRSFCWQRLPSIRIYLSDLCKTPSVNFQLDGLFRVRRSFFLMCLLIDIAGDVCFFFFCETTSRSHRRLAGSSIFHSFANGLIQCV